MSAIGIIIMWIWTAVVFTIWNRWATGKEVDRRQVYWNRYEAR